MAKLIVVIGLPGSGKSRYLNQLLADKEIDEKYDDYHGEAFDNSGDPRLSKDYGPLLAALKANKNVGVSDIVFCLDSRLHIFLAAVYDVVPAIQVEFCYFRNDSEKCKANVLSRDRDSRVEQELEFIDTYSPQYVIPTHQVFEIYAG